MVTSGEEGVRCLDAVFLVNSSKNMVSYIIFLKLHIHLTEVIERSALICVNVHFIIKD